MISVVTPSRGRPDLTKKLIDSAYDNASDPSNIEMIFRFDNDDPHFKELLKLTDRYDSCHMLVGPRLFGYSSLHEMVNDGCRYAEGNGIMTGNNDMEFASKNWDLEYERLIEENPISVIQIRKNKKNGSAIQFPLITRKVYEILGHYSLHTSIDGYISWVGIMARCMIYSNVEMAHLHVEDDDVYTDRVDSDKEKQHTFRAEETQRLIVEDAKKLSEAIGMNELADFYGWAR